MIHYTFSLTHGSGSEAAVVKVRMIADSTLFDLAEALLNGIGFDCDHAFGFHSDLKNPYAKNMRREYTLFADDGEGRIASDTGVENTGITEVFEVGDKMLFHFDYGDDWRFLVECVAVEEGVSRKRKPEVLEIVGEFPAQYEEPDYDEMESRFGINLNTGERIEIRPKSSRD